MDLWQEILARSMPWTGKRIRLRVITPDDARLHMRLSNDADVRRFMGPPLNLTETQAVDGLRRISPATDSLYVIESAPDGMSLGYCGFLPNRDIPETDMLISLLPEYQRYGYGGEVLSILKSAWLVRLGNEECFATVWPENTKAVGLLRSHGFSHVRAYTDFFEKIHHVYKCSRVSIGPYLGDAQECAGDSKP